MTNAAIAAIFSRISKILDLKGENPFRVRAYDRASMAIGSWSRELTDIYEERGLDALKEIPGIGEDLARKIEELSKTGELNYLKRLEYEVPKALLEIMDIPGMGPKKTKVVWKTFKVKGIDDLERLAKSGKLAALKGWGDTSAENVLKGIKMKREGGARVALPVALAEAEQIVAELKKTKLALKLEIAGSLRRCKETTGDIDILATSEKPAKMMEVFTTLPQVDSIVAKGPTRSSVRLKAGLNADLRVVEPDVFGAALHYFTGSKEHNVHVRTIAVQRGITMNEYGVFKGMAEEKGRRLASKTEEDVFAAMSLPYIPPELREDRGEIEAAVANKLPDLIKEGDLKGDLHIHSTFSDGSLSMIDMARTAERAGLAYIAITDHASPMGMVGGVKQSNIGQYLKFIEEARRAIPGVKILAGAEVDVLPDGRLFLPDEVLGKLDWVVASVHGKFNMTRDEMTARLLRAIENPFVHLIGHPTARLLTKRPPIEFNVDEVFKAAKKHGVAMELNASTERLDLSDVLCKRAKELGVKICIDSDAHSLPDFNYRFGISQARRGWLTKEDVLNTLSWEKFRQTHLSERRRERQHGDSPSFYTC